jgi:hypothetical protein
VLWIAKLKPKLTTLAFFIGLILCLGPWLFIENPEKYWYWISLLGGVLTTFSGYNSQSKMMDMGEPGEEMLQSWLKRFKEAIRRCKN